MEIISDFHIHSRYAMACSPSITIKGLAHEAQEKEIKLLIGKAEPLLNSSGMRKDSLGSLSGFSRKILNV